MSHFDYTRCPEILTISPGGVPYIISRFKYTHGNLDRDISTVVIFADNVYRHPWEPSTVVDFDTEERYSPEYLLFLNRTTRSHVIDEQFVIVEISKQEQRIRIAQGDAQDGTLSNTIQFSISQGQIVMDIRATDAEIWIQADNNRLTVLVPNHAEKKFNWKQVYHLRGGLNCFII